LNGKHTKAYKNKTLDLIFLILVRRCQMRIDFKNLSLADFQANIQCK